MFFYLGIQRVHLGEVSADAEEQELVNDMMKLLLVEKQENVGLLVPLSYFLLRVLVLSSLNLIIVQEHSKKNYNDR